MRCLKYKSMPYRAVPHQTTARQAAPNQASPDTTSIVTPGPLERRPAPEAIADLDMAPHATRSTTTWLSVRNVRNFTPLRSAWL